MGEKTMEWCGANELDTVKLDDSFNKDKKISSFWLGGFVEKTTFFVFFGIAIQIQAD